MDFPDQKRLYNSQNPIYKRHTQANDTDFVEHIIEKFAFRIREIGIDNSHESQAKFHGHVEDKGIRHAYVKPSSPQLNGKVERSCRSDQREFYQLLSDKDDVELEAKLMAWGNFYNIARPLGASTEKHLTKHSVNDNHQLIRCLAETLTLQY